MRQKPRVIYWNNIPAPYMVEKFNALADRGNFKFEAWFNERSLPDRSWTVDESTWRFNYRYLPSADILGIRLYLPTPLLRTRVPDVLVSLYAEPSFLLGWLLARWRRMWTVFRVLKVFDLWVPPKPFKELVKRVIFSRVDGIETPGSDGKAYALKYRTREAGIFIAIHGFDVHHFRRKAAACQVRRHELRAQLGLSGTTFLYVGQLWWGKGLGYLLDAFHELQQAQAEEVSLLIVGDGEDEGKLRLQCQQQRCRNVVFAGFRQRDELPAYYAISDVLVFPSLGDPYGLVVDEAMACGLPVISTSAAGEIYDRVTDGDNGFVIEPAQSKALYDTMTRLLHDEPLREHMGRRSYQRIRSHTADQWAEDFERGILQVIGTA